MIKIIMVLILSSLLLQSCQYGLLTPEVIEQLKDDKATVGFHTQGGPGGIPYGALSFCRGNSEGHSKCEIKEDGSINIEHNISTK